MNSQRDDNSYPDENNIKESPLNSNSIFSSSMLSNHDKYQTSMEILFPKQNSTQYNELINVDEFHN